MRLATVFLFLTSLALAQGTRNATLTWSHPDTPPTVTFNVYRASGVCPATQTPFPTKLNPTPVSAKTYTDSGVAYGTYCYQVTAVGGGLESVRSNDAPAAVAPTSPTGLQTTVATATIIVDEKGVLTANLDVKTTSPAALAPLSLPMVPRPAPAPDPDLN